MKMNIGKYFWRHSSLIDLPPALPVSESLIMKKMHSYFKLKFSVEKLK